MWGEGENSGKRKIPWTFNLERGVGWLTIPAVLREAKFPPSRFKTDSFLDGDWAFLVQMALINAEPHEEGGHIGSYIYNTHCS